MLFRSAAAAGVALGLGVLSGRVGAGRGSGLRAGGVGCGSGVAVCLGAGGVGTAGKGLAGALTAGPAGSRRTASGSPAVGGVGAWRGHSVSAPTCNSNEITNPSAQRLSHSADARHVKDIVINP